jgi:hypothetical protein
MLPVGFEPTIPANERPQTQALDRAATGIGNDYYYYYYYYYYSTTATIATTATNNNNKINNNKTVRKGAENRGNLRRMTVFEEVEGGEV